MPKINKEEYEILKELIGESFKWICRGEGGNLFAYELKPNKGNFVWLYRDSSSKVKKISNSDLFQFIQWEDEEPYDIQELIKEYEFGKILLAMAEEGIVLEFECESEETKTKKDIQWSKDWDWARREFNKLYPGKVEAYVNQDDKTTTEIRLLNKVQSIFDQLDEPETLSQEWIDKNVVHVRGLGDIIAAEAVENILVPEQEVTFEQVYDKLREESILSEKSFDYYWNCISDNVEIDEPGNLLVPKQEDMFNGEKPDEVEVYFAIGLGGAVEINVARSIGEAIEILTEHETNYSVSRKPVIPKFVAEHIEKWKNSNVSLSYALSTLRDELTHFRGSDEQTKMWLYHPVDGFENQELYARAWLDGFTVEEEQKYYAKIKGHELFNDSEEGYWNVDGKELYIDNAWHDYSGYKTTILTKDEWTNLGINEDNADFVKVEELEE